SSGSTSATSPRSTSAAARSSPATRRIPPPSSRGATSSATAPTTLRSPTSTAAAPTASTTPASAPRSTSTSAASPRSTAPSRAALPLEQALPLDPAPAGPLDSLADLAYRQHDWERANTLYSRMDPEVSFLGADVVHYRRGELAEMLGHEDEAEAAYHAAVAANPYHISALEAIARLALYRGEVTAAIGALRAVLDLLPLDDVERITTLRQQLGDLCQRAGDNAAARGYYELVLVEDPGRVTVLMPLAELYAAAEMWREAT